MKSLNVSRARPNKLIGIGILTYNRTDYLRAFLEALANQDSHVEFDLVVLDNGSSEPVLPLCADIAPRLNASVRFLREQDNHLGVDRYQQLIDAVDAEFVFLPGDDDLPLTNFISTTHQLAEGNPDSMLVSTSMAQINARGHRLAPVNAPPRYEDAPSAMASLLTSPGYNMPATGFRKQSVNLLGAPRTRTTIDWWLWLQAWCQGPAAVSDVATVLYRQHSGQQQRMYGSQAFRNDAGRMLLGFLESPQFTKLLAKWTERDVETFSRVLMASEGPNYGDSRWGPLVQMVIADRLLEIGWGKAAVDLLAQASGHAGSPASLGTLRALGSAGSLDSYPDSVWSRVPASIDWRADCHRALAWREYLNLASHRRPQFRIDFDCTCRNSRSPRHLLDVEGRRFDGTASFHLRLRGEPNEVEATMFLEQVGLMTGRLHGFESGVGFEERLARRLQMFRLTRLGAFIEQRFKRLMVLAR